MKLQEVWKMALSIVMILGFGGFVYFFLDSLLCDFFGDDFEK